VDISFMNLIAWSPAVCKELKRLCTRVAKKRALKAKRIEQAPFSGDSTNMFNLCVGNRLSNCLLCLRNLRNHSLVYLPLGLRDHFSPSLSHLFRDFSQLCSKIPKIQGGLYLSNISSMVASTEAEKHTRFLSTIICKDKAFRIPCTIKKADGANIRLEKSYVQADQGSDMNVISTGLVRQIGLDMHSLSEIGFRGLTMRTADHRETLLEHWVWLNIGVEGVWRSIRYFVTPELVTLSGETGYLSLILGIPWLWFIMRDSGEAIREVTGPELVFCEEHNLLMYPKSALAASKAKAACAETDSESSSSSDSEDDLSDVEDPKPPFQ